MRRTSFVATTIFLVIVMLAASSIAQMLRPQYSQAEQLVVLTNGEILIGQVKRNAEQVIVDEQGSLLVIPADQVDFVCQSINQAYWGRAARTKASDIEGQQRLFHWCLKNKLLNHAQNQIDILLHTDVKASDLENLDRQLNVALMQQRAAKRRTTEATRQLVSEFSPPPESPHASQEANRLAPIEIATIGSQSLIDQTNATSEQFDLAVFRPLPRFDSAAANQVGSESQFAELPPLGESKGERIQQVGFEEEVYETISPTNRMLSPASLTSESIIQSNSESPSAELPRRDDRIMTSIPDLNRETRSLPDGVVGHYRSRVERALIFGCHAAKCHDTDSRMMPLLQTSPTQPITRLQSQRNLHNVLKYIDRSNPFESELFLAATELHAGLDQSIFKIDTERGENLVKWLVLLSDDPQKSLLDAIQLTETGQVSVPDGNTGEFVPVKPAPMGPVPMEGSSLQFPDTIGEIPKLNAGEKAFVPIDPFDPEIFNRKFRR